MTIVEDLLRCAAAAAAGGGRRRMADATWVFPLLSWRLAIASSRASSASSTTTRRGVAVVVVGGGEGRGEGGDVGDEEDARHEYDGARDADEVHL
jgi:hypothetical protein